MDGDVPGWTVALRRSDTELLLPEETVEFDFYSEAETYYCEPGIGLEGRSTAETERSLKTTPKKDFSAQIVLTNHRVLLNIGGFLCQQWLSSLWKVALDQSLFQSKIVLIFSARQSMLHFSRQISSNRFKCNACEVENENSLFCASCGVPRSDIGTILASNSYSDCVESEHRRAHSMLRIKSRIREQCARLCRFHERLEWGVANAAWTALTNRIVGQSKPMPIGIAALSRQRAEASQVDTAVQCVRELFVRIKEIKELAAQIAQRKNLYLKGASGGRLMDMLELCRADGSFDGRSERDIVRDLARKMFESDPKLLVLALTDLYCAVNTAIRAGRLRLESGARFITPSRFALTVDEAAAHSDLYVVAFNGIKAVIRPDFVAENLVFAILECIGRCAEGGSGLTKLQLSEKLHISPWILSAQLSEMELGGLLLRDESTHGIFYFQNELDLLT